MVGGLVSLFLSLSFPAGEVKGGGVELRRSYLHTNRANIAFSTYTLVEVAVERGRVVMYVYYTLS